MLVERQHGYDVIEIEERCVARETRDVLLMQQMSNALKKDKKKHIDVKRCARLKRWVSKWKWQSWAKYLGCYKGESCVS